jgi:hypothetical protein
LVARYSAGGGWCFGCHKTDKPDKLSMFEQPEEEEGVVLPFDLCNDFPPHVLEWVGKYHVTVGEMLKYEWKYSPTVDQLLFIFNRSPLLEIGTSGIGCVQGRNFRKGSRKYFNSGSVSEVLPLFQGPDHSRSCVVVEDALSAARIARLSSSLACLGSYLPARKIMALWALNFRHLVVWLDADKYKEALEIADMAKWIGMTTQVVYTEKDPKEYLDTEIEEYLQHK